MPMMKLDQLRLGMTAAADVLNNRNQVLIPQGTVIEAPHLRALKIWGIASVPIVENGGKGHPREKTSGSQLKKEVLEEINRLFRPVYKKPLHPVIKTIIPVCAKAISQKQELTQSGRVFDSESPSFPLDEQAAGRLTVEEIIRNTKDLFSLPDIHNQLMAEINNPYSSAADIAGVVGNDPGLTARLLRIVNSAFYGFPSKIESVAQGVSILGTKELCDLALATSVIRVFDDALKGVVNMKRFWYHSVGCGVIAKELAVCRNETGVERFFVMGILHDIGRLVLFSQAPKEMAWALTSASEQEKPLYQVEKECLG
ncbi:MAG TPA: hypothetical protein DHV36_12605, partial [Desulfobacteraceae bacterium]|nr:hypothetical protein [Desulfobacteraceae bacterium]